MIKQSGFRVWPCIKAAPKQDMMGRTARSLHSIWDSLTTLICSCRDVREADCSQGAPAQVYFLFALVRADRILSLLHLPSPPSPYPNFRYLACRQVISIQFTPPRLTHERCSNVNTSSTRAGPYWRTRRTSAGWCTSRPAFWWGPADITRRVTQRISTPRTLT